MAHFKLGIETLETEEGSCDFITFDFGDGDNLVVELERVLDEAHLRVQDIERYEHNWQGVELDLARGPQLEALEG